MRKIKLSADGTKTSENVIKLTYPQQETTPSQFQVSQAPIPPKPVVKLVDQSAKKEAESRAEAVKPLEQEDYNTLIGPEQMNIIDQYMNTSKVQP